MATGYSGSDLEARAMAVIPGFQSNLRKPLIKDGMCLVKAQGARLWDADGREYIDYVISSGGAVLGHGNPDFMNAVKDQLDRIYYSFCGGSWTIPEIELAEEFVKLVPCADKVRFLLSGSEAVQLALRLARAYTGRRWFLRFEGHYHGWLDNVLGGGINPDSQVVPHAVDMEGDVKRTEGRDEAAFEQGLMLPWNDLEALDRVLARYGDRVAVTMMEPILVNNGCCPPRPGFLEGVRELCDRYGILLFFDEVITGFRVHLSGAQGLFGVKPDIATYGKAFAGGLPTSAVVGRAEIMDLLEQGRVIGAGTFNGYPLGMASALATLKILQADDGAFYRRTRTRQDALMAGLGEIADRRGLPLFMQGPLGAIGLLFIEADEIHDYRTVLSSDIGMLVRFIDGLNQRGILAVGGRMYVSDGLTDADIFRTLQAADEVMAAI